MKRICRQCGNEFECAGACTTSKETDECNCGDCIMRGREDKLDTKGICDYKYTNMEKVLLT
jgi:hypothetical protein